MTPQLIRALWIGKPTKREALALKIALALRDHMFEADGTQRPHAFDVQHQAAVIAGFLK